MKPYFDIERNTFCPECGFDVTVDEDGCCIGCGAVSVGNAVDKLYSSAPVDQIKKNILHLLNEFKYKSE